MRSKRSTSILTNQTYTLTYNDAEMTVNIGIVFDGFGRYEEDALRDSNGSFNLCTPPSISYKALIQFDPHKDTTITIEVTTRDSKLQRKTYIHTYIHTLYIGL